MEAVGFNVIFQPFSSPSPNVLGKHNLVASAKCTALARAATPLFN
jgi:hypothetical protein